MRYINTALTAILMLALTTVPATADHAGKWDANGDSFIVNETTVHLEGGNTSVETAALNITVDAGEVVTFNYELFDAAECTGGAPRVFLIINGANTNSWDQLQPTDEQCGTDGSVTFVTENAGGITAAGIVYDNDGSGHVLVSDLTINGELVHFMNPEPEPEVCEWDDSITAEDKKCVEPEEEEPKEETTPEPTPEETDESEDITVPTEIDTGNSLPKTGINPFILAGGALLALIVGTGMFLGARRKTT